MAAPRERYPGAAQKLREHQAAEGRAFVADFLDRMTPWAPNEGTVMAGLGAGHAIEHHGMSTGDGRVMLAMSPHEKALKRAGLLSALVGEAVYQAVRAWAATTDLSANNRLQANEFLNHGNQMYNPYDDQ